MGSNKLALALFFASCSSLYGQDMPAPPSVPAWPQAEIEELPGARPSASEQEKLLELQELPHDFISPPSVRVKQVPSTTNTPVDAAPSPAAEFKELPQDLPPPPPSVQPESAQPPIPLSAPQEAPVAPLKIEKPPAIDSSSPVLPPSAPMLSPATKRTPSITTTIIPAPPAPAPDKGESEEKTNSSSAPPVKPLITPLPVPQRKPTPAPRPAPPPTPSSSSAPAAPTAESIINLIPSQTYPRPKPAGNPITLYRETPAFGDDKPQTASVEREGLSLSVSKTPPSIQDELNLGYEALMHGHYAAARRMYKSVLKRQPGQKLALFGLATTYHKEKQYAKARTFYHELLRRYPDFADGLNNFLLLLGEEEPAEALAQLDMLASRNPGFSAIPAQKALIHWKLGNYREAVTLFSDAIQLAPENLTYRYNMAVMLDEMGESLEAAKLYDQLLEHYRKGNSIPASPQRIQERLTFLRSNGG